jgi:hypothetical protein
MHTMATRQHSCNLTIFTLAPAHLLIASVKKSAPSPPELRIADFFFARVLPMKGKEGKVTAYVCEPHSLADRLSQEVSTVPARAAHC